FAAEAVRGAAPVPTLVVVLRTYAQLWCQSVVGRQERAEVRVQVQDVPLEARGLSRPREDTFGDEYLANVMHHCRQGELPQPRLVEAEGDADPPRETRGADAVDVGRRARPPEPADERAHAVAFGAVARTFGAPARAEAADRRVPVRVHQP